MTTQTVSALGSNLLSNPSVESFSGSGSGTAGNPYIITTVEELQEMNDNKTAYYILGNDIDASATSGWNSGAGFIPIGTTATNFTGSFDGRGCKISNLYINRGGENYIGLYGYVGSGGVVENAWLENENVVGDNTVGGLVGLNYGTVSNCYSTGSVSGNIGVGGLAGRNYYGTVSNCYSTCTVSGLSCTGGLVGCNYYDGTVSNCYSTGTVSGGPATGGLVGYNWTGTVSNCYSTGTVSGVIAVGGLVGDDSHGTMSNCYATGPVSGSDWYVGGLVGCTDGTVSNCYSTGTVSGGPATGGLVGGNMGGTIYNCYSTGTVSSSSQMGGLTGGNFWDGTIYNCFWDNETSGQSSSFGGTGKTTDNMKDVRTFTDNTWSEGLDTPWDFVGNPYGDLGNENIWNIDSGINNGYPFLAWQAALVHNVTKDIWYITIQPAIDAASSGDTILVYPGTFYENVFIQKSITLTGTDKEAVIIDGTGLSGEGIAVEISGAPWGVGPKNVVISNLTIRNNGLSGIGLNHSDNCTVENLIVKNCDIGITLFGSADNNIVRNNAIDNCGNAIALQGSNLGCTYNVIAGNTITNCGTGGYASIVVMSGASYNTIENNTVTGDLTADGISLSSKLYPNFPETGNTIRNNTISGVNRGIWIRGYNASSVPQNLVSNTTIVRNTLTSNQYGILVVGFTDNVIGSVHFNNIVGNQTYGIYNNSSSTFNATCNWWGNASGPGGSGPGTGDNITDNVLYSPWLGFTVGTVPMTFHVDNTGTIQSAIDAASSGDTVIVHDGTYRENLFIDKSITLKSASKPIIEAPDSIALRSYTGPSGTQNYRSIIEVYNTTGVTINGFIIDGRGVGNANDKFVGIHFFEASGTISNNEIKGVRNTPLSGSQDANAIVVNHLWDQYYDQSVMIENNVIYDYQKNGITCNESGTAATVENNIVTGAGPITAIAQNGIQIGYGATATVQGNKVSGNSWIGSGWAATGILVSDNSVDVLANEVDNNYIGIYYADASGNISGNTVNDSAAGTGRTDFTGILVFPNNAGGNTYTNSVTGNVLTGDDSSDSYAIEVYVWSTHTINFTGTKNTVTDWGTGFEFYAEEGSTLNATARFNNITSNVNYGMETNVLVNATCNWWGDASGPYNPTTNPLGLGNSVSDNVTYTGWARAPIGTVWIDVSPGSLSGTNGATLNYTVTVQNPDNASRTFDLTDNAGPSWLPSLSPSSLTIQPNENSTATFSVTVPSDAIGGTIYNMMVTATSEDNPLVNASASCTATVTVTRSVSISISPSDNSGANGALLHYTVTVNNTGNVNDIYTLTPTDNAIPTWSPSVPSPLAVSAFSSGNATLSVTIPLSAIVGTIDNITVTANGTGDSASSTCTALVTVNWTGTATFRLENIYKVNLYKDNLWLYTGRKLVVKFYNYDGVTFQAESVIHENWIIPWHVVPENENVPQPRAAEGYPAGTVQIARLVLTTDDTGNIISTIASFTVRQGDLRTRYGNILRVWGDQPEQQSAFRTEIGDIMRQWSSAPT